MRLSLIALLTAGGLVLSAAQSQQPIRVGTSFVRVDVYPTRDGRIVEGLQAADFEVLEDNVLQKIESFEHVIPVLGPQTTRTDPNSQREMVRAIGNPRSRLFLIFLDGAFVDDESARQINEPLRKFLSQNLADDDLVGVMTPAMSAQQVVFGKKIEVMTGGLPTAFLSWGRQNRELDGALDKREIQYTLCYPGMNDVPPKMIVRSRERKTLEALQDAVKYLASVREERKAIITVTEGWVLYREDLDMMRQRSTEAPLGRDKMRVGPTGKLTLEDTKTSVNALSPDACDRDRTFLASIDNDRFLREIVDDANRGNSSFYLIDPGGLKTARRADRTGAMRTLGEGTDGFAMLNTNDLNKGFERIVEDLSSYYLLGYNAANTKNDGRFRSITVRVKQPGIAIRARKGYRAPSPGEVITSPAAVPATSAATTAVQTALDQLSRIRPTAQFRVNAVLGPGPIRPLWVMGELRSDTSRPDEFARGGSVAIEAVAGGASVTATATLKPGQRVFFTRLEVLRDATGTVDVKVRLTADDGGGIPLTDAVRLDLASTDPRPVMFRRGPTTGPQFVAAPDPVFSRTERLRIEVPVGPSPRDGKPGSAHILDRGGTATQVTVAVSERLDDATGQRWITADANLAALSPADYVVELVIVKDAGETKLLTPIRVGR